MSDRTVHGTGTDDSGNHYEVVRYDRAGTWWIEYGTALLPRRRVGVTTAARAAQEPRLRLPGGLRFDSIVHQLAAERFGSRQPPADHPDGSGAGGASEGEGGKCGLPFGDGWTCDLPKGHA